MKLTFKDLLSEKEWLHRELLVSLPHEVITEAAEKQYYDVKLLVNGEEIEPKLYNDIVINVEKYVDNEASNIVNEKFEDVTEMLNSLNYLVEEVKQKIMDKFDIKNYED